MNNKEQIQRAIQEQTDYILQILRDYSFIPSIKFDTKYHYSSDANDNVYHTVKAILIKQGRLSEIK